VPIDSRWLAAADSLSGYAVMKDMRLFLPLPRRRGRIRQCARLFRDDTNLVDGFNAPEVTQIDPDLYFLSRFRLILFLHSELLELHDEFRVNIENFVLNFR
jgi:hypothetical protein